MQKRTAFQQLGLLQSSSDYLSYTDKLLLFDSFFKFSTGSESGTFRIIGYFADHRPVFAKPFALEAA